MDFSRWRRRRNLSSSSGSSSIQVPAPKLHPPAAYRTSTTDSTESTIRQKNRSGKAPIMPPMLLGDADEDDIIPCNNLTRYVPTEAKPFHPTQASPEEDVISRNAMFHYMKDSFCTREPQSWQTTKSIEDSIVVFEIHTSADVRYEGSRITSTLLPCLAEIYQRSEQSIMVTIQPNTCILFGSSPFPAYFLKVFAHPSLIAPLMNRRNTIFIQSALREALHISPDRGVIVYLPIPGENLATNGSTFMDETPQREQRSSRDDSSSIFKSLSRSVSRKLGLTNVRSTQPSEASASSLGESQTAPREERQPGEDQQSEKASNAENPQPQGVKRSRSLRFFVSRRLSELGSLGDVQ